MPTYEYTCRDCGHTFDIVQSMWDEPLTMCPECGGSLRKVFAPPAIAFKGPGFYATDHRKKAKTPSGEKQTEGPREGAREGKEGGEKKDGREKRDRGAADSKPTADAASKKEPAAS